MSRVFQKLLKLARSRSDEGNFSNCCFEPRSVILKPQRVWCEWPTFIVLSMETFFLLSPALYYFRHPRWRHDFATFRFDPHQNTPALQDILHCSLTKRKQGHSSTKEKKLRYRRILIPAIQTGRTNSGFHRNQTFLIVCSPIKFKGENDPYQSEFSQMR